MTEATLKIAALISKITHICAQELGEGDIRSILTAASEVRADHVTVNRLLHAVNRAQKIEAIKEYRALTGSTLLDAKNAIEGYWPHPVGTHATPFEAA